MRCRSLGSTRVRSRLTRPSSRTRLAGVTRNASRLGRVQTGSAPSKGCAASSTTGRRHSSGSCARWGGIRESTHRGSISMAARLRRVLASSSRPTPPASTTLSTVLILARPAGRLPRARSAHHSRLILQVRRTSSRPDMSGNTSMTAPMPAQSGGQWISTMLPGPQGHRSLATVTVTRPPKSGG